MDFSIDIVSLLIGMFLMLVILIIMFVAGARSIDEEDDNHDL